MAFYDIPANRDARDDLGDDDDEDAGGDPGDEESFAAVYDRAVARVVACRQQEAETRAQHKMAKEELAAACAQLEALRSTRQPELPGLSRL